MKNMKIPARILVTTILFLVSGNTYANIFKQGKVTLSHFNSVSVPSGYLKLPAVAHVQDDSLNKFKENYPAVYKKLIKKFDNVKSLKYTIGKKLIYLSFSDKENKVDACFSQAGFIRYSISYMGTTLPETLIGKIKTVYPDYTIFYGKCIRISNETIYQVIIESNFEYRVINFSNEEMEEIKKCRKQFIK